MGGLSHRTAPLQEEAPATLLAQVGEGAKFNGQGPVKCRAATYARVPITVASYSRAGNEKGGAGVPAPPFRSPTPPRGWT